VLGLHTGVCRAFAGRVACLRARVLLAVLRCRRCCASQSLILPSISLYSENRYRCEVTSCSPCKNLCKPVTPPGSPAAAAAPKQQQAQRTFTLANPAPGGLLVRGVPLAGLTGGVTPPPFYTGPGSGSTSGAPIVAAGKPRPPSPVPSKSSSSGSSDGPGRHLLQASPNPSFGLATGRMGMPRPRSMCPDGRMPVMCFLNPCQQGAARCPKGTACVPNYCGGCKADCVGGSGSPVTGDGGMLRAGNGGLTPARSTLGGGSSSGAAAGALPTSMSTAAGANPTTSSSSSGSVKPSAASPQPRSLPATLVATSGRLGGAAAPATAAAAAAPDKTPAQAAIPAPALPGGAQIPGTPGGGPIARAGVSGGAIFVSSWGGCPAGVMPVLCAQSPCLGKQCASGSHCVENLCGGCNAECKAGPPPEGAKPPPSGPMI